MRKPRDRIEVSGDDATTFPNQPRLDDENAQFSQLYLQQSIDQLRRLRDDYRQIRLWLEKMGQQFAQREAIVSQRIQEAMAFLAQLRRRLGSSSDPAPWTASPKAPANQLTLHVHTLGKFKVHHNDQTVSLGNNKKGRAVFRYLVTRPRRRAAKDVLLDLFWPGEGTDKASHKLHIAVSALRQALSKAESTALEHDQYLLFEDGHYFLHPAINIHLDADELAARCQAGERLARDNHIPEAIAEYEAALALYQGDFLTEDLYADWAIADRARLEETYLTLLGHLAEHYLGQGHYTESISCCRQILAKDSFREDAYRQLMLCYSRLGRRNQALREFHICEQVLQRELGVRPMQETVALYERIVQEEAV